jgi:TolB-like protein
LPPKFVVGHANTLIIMEALLDDITAGLTRYRSISVLAAHTGRVQTSRNESIASLNTRYGVHYAVTTSVKPTSTGTMTTFLLIDVRTEECLAAIDCPLDPDGLSDLFARVGKEVVRQLVSAIEVHEMEFPSAAAGRSGYRHYLEGRRSMWQADLPDLRRARGAFQRALSSSNDFAPAYSGMSRTLSMEKLVRGLRTDDLLLDAMEMAERAIRLDPLDGRGMCQRGFANLYLRRHDESLENFAAAAALNPNDADMHADHADALSHAGLGEEALKACLQAKRLSPEWPEYYDWIHGSIQYQLGRYENAVDTLKQYKGNPVFCRLLAASSAMSGDTAEAARYAQMLKANYPEFSLADLKDIVPDKNAQDTRHLIEGLRLAGVR